VWAAQTLAGFSQPAIRQGAASAAMDEVDNIIEENIRAVPLAPKNSCFMVMVCSLSRLMDFFAAPLLVSGGDFFNNGADYQPVQTNQREPSNFLISIK
jgi:hypothetical protein